jgi:hypothetical protein
MTRPDLPSSLPRAFAVLGHIDGNLEALRAVLTDAEAGGARQVACLGNLVGAGGNPAECVDLVFERSFLVLRGCSDETVLGARAGLAALDGDVFVHGTPGDPIHGAINMRQGDRSLQPIFGTFGRFLFCAHSVASDGRVFIDHNTHEGRSLVAVRDETLPPFDPSSVDWGLEGLDVYGCWSAERLGGCWTRTGARKGVVTVGAVAPLGESQASYVLVEGDRLTWRRVAFDRGRGDAATGTRLPPSP